MNLLADESPRYCNVIMCRQVSWKNIDDGENSRERTSYSTHVWLHSVSSIITKKINSLSSPKYYPQIFDLRYTTVLSTVVGLLSFEIFLLDKIVDRQISDEDFQVFMGSKVATCVPDTCRLT